jgi:hypothetical protein
MVLNNKCKKCNHTCNAIYFQQNFESWTSGNDDIDKLIRDTQLSAHYNVKDDEFIQDTQLLPYYNVNNYDYSDNFNLDTQLSVHYNIEDYNSDKFIQDTQLSAYHNMQFYDYYGDIFNQDTQLSGHHDIKDYDSDIFIQDTQLSAYYNVKNYNYSDIFNLDTQQPSHFIMNEALEWIPYNRFNDIKCITDNNFVKVCTANWIDGNISHWDNDNQNWKRFDQNKVVTLKSLNNTNYIKLKLANEV